MERSVSLRIDGVLAEREKVSRVVTSLQGELVSWKARPDLGRTYGIVRAAEGCEPEAMARAVSPAARAHDPALLFLEVFPDHRRCLDALRHALGGAGRPAGIVDALATERSVFFELDATRTPLSLIIDVIDTELEHAPGRRIVPLFPLEDAVLTSLARDFLGDPAWDVQRLIETHVD